MNQMIDQMRVKFRETYGEYLYNRVVSAEEREKTERRLAASSNTGQMQR